MGPIVYHVGKNTMKSKGTFQTKYLPTHFVSKGFLIYLFVSYRHVYFTKTLDPNNISQHHATPLGLISAVSLISALIISVQNGAASRARVSRGGDE